MKKKKRKMTWQKNLNKGLNKVIKNQKKEWNAKQKIHLQAAKKRKNKVEQNVDRMLIASCFGICLIAALMEVKEKRL